MTAVGPRPFDDREARLGARALLGLVALAVLLLVIGGSLFAISRVERPAAARRAAPGGESGAAALYAEQENLLSSYGWVDREAAVVHIPIERAIELEATASEGE